MKIAIIGAGPAGEATAKTALKINPKAEITLIERDHPGGLCLNKGCIPSKALLEQVHKNGTDWKTLQEFKSGVVQGIRSQLELSLKRLKVNVIKGTASFESPQSLSVNSKSIPFDKAVITAGTENFVPPPLDQYKDKLLDSDKVLELKKTPASLVVIGGGAVGLEFACLLNKLGSKVTIIEMQPTLLPGEDAAVVSALTRIYESRGITVKTETKVTEIEHIGPQWKLKLSSNEEIEAEHVLVSVGRRPHLAPFNLEKANIELEKDQIKLNEFLQTTNPNVYAAGDVTGITRLAHAAAAMGEKVGQNLSGAQTQYNGNLVPRCLYSWPEVASVGQWKYECEDKNQPVKATRAFFKGNSKALAADESDGFVQVVSNPEDGKIYGAQILGAHATELIHVFCVAIHQGMTTKELGEVMFAHPTLSESIGEACRK